MIILANKQDEMNVVNEERQNWLQRVLVALGADEAIIKRNTINAKNHIASIGLDVILKPEGEIDIYRYDYEHMDNPSYDPNQPEIAEPTITIEKDSYLVAQWFKPVFVLKKENGEKFYEIHIEEWALPFQMANLGE